MTPETPTPNYGEPWRVVSIPDGGIASSDGEAIKNASHFASCILTEVGRQWQATQPLPGIVSIESVAQQIQDELQPLLK